MLSASYVCASGHFLLPQYCTYSATLQESEEGTTMATKEKIAAVSELKELFEASNAVILTEYRGLTVAQLK